MKYRRGILAMVLVIAAAVTMNLHSQEQYVPLPHTVLRPYTETLQSTPVITFEGRAHANYTGIIKIRFDRIRQAGDKHTILTGFATPDKQNASSKQAAEPVTSILQMRDSNDKPMWSRLFTGDIDAVRYDGKNVIVIAGYQENGMPRVSQMVTLNNQGHKLWSREIPDGDYNDQSIESLGDRILLISWGEWLPGSIVSAISVDRNGYKPVLKNKQPNRDNLYYLGHFDGRYRFVRNSQLNKTTSYVAVLWNTPSSAEMFELDHNGKVLSSLKIQSTIYAKFHTLASRQLLIQDRYSTLITPWMKYTPKEVYRWETRKWSQDYMVLDSNNPAAPVIQQFHNANEASREWTAGLSMMDTSKSDSWKPRQMAKGHVIDGDFDPVCALYGSTDVLTVVPGTHESKLLLFNRYGHTVGLYMVSKHITNPPSITQVGSSTHCVVSSYETTDQAIIPIVSIPLIRTTPTADGLRVRITCATKGANIRYSVDTRDPDSKGQRYRGEFTVPKGSTITARATAPRTLPSQIAER
ncbi:MAG: chitobiase/beta-hexosaminidase C-terminal domain-containing protein [Armatimonadota bacterium]